MEHRALPRPGRVLPRLWRLRRQRDGARGLHRRIHRRAGERARSAHADRDRAARDAKKGDKVVRIITADELKSGAARTKKDGMLTWKYQARNVRDAVWAASPDFQWDASSYKGSYAFAFYRPSAVATWDEAADMARMSIQEYSERWLPYPW